MKLNGYTTRFIWDAHQSIFTVMILVHRLSILRVLLRMLEVRQRISASQGEGWG